MDVENIDALDLAELDALLERALDPRVPVEVLYAVLERIGRLEQEAAAGHPAPAEFAAPPEFTAPAGPAPQAASAEPQAAAPAPPWTPYPTVQLPAQAKGSGAAGLGGPAPSAGEPGGESEN